MPHSTPTGNGAVLAPPDPGAAQPTRPASTGIPPELAQFVLAIFDPSDLVLIRPVETWMADGKKRSRVDYRGILHRSAQALAENSRLWELILRNAEAEKANLFFGVCPRFAGKGQYDLAWQIRVVRVLWADLDNCTTEEALERCNRARLPHPSIIVWSGHGVHLYWLLTEAYRIDDAGKPPPVYTEWIDQGPGKKKKPRKFIRGQDGEKRIYEGSPDFPSLSPKARHVQNILAGIAAQIGGDHTQDLARLLRLPSTLNRKDQRNGKAPVPCTLVECESGRRYPLADFERFAELAPDAVKTQKAAKVRLPTGRKLTPARLNRLTDYINASALADVGDRSERDFALCCWCVREGLDPGAVWSQVENVGKFAEEGRRYFDLTWEKAEQAARERVCQRLSSATKPGAHGTPNTLKAAEGQPAEPTPASRPMATDRPTILITTEEHEVNDQAVQCLGRELGIYQRGGLLARVTRDHSPAARGIRRPFAPRIETLPPPLLRERLAANARWITLCQTPEGPEEKPAHPPVWCVAAVHARANWPGVRHLEAVVDYPVLRPDGTLVCTPGYDPDTGLLLEPAGDLPVVPDAPTKVDAIAARDALLDLLADFPLERPVHRAAWLAALLTPLARFAFVGPAPLFLVDANVRGCGKGLLLDCISRIVTGERFTIATYTSDEDELRKRITSLALAGDRLVLFDNLEGNFGNAVLDAALTGTAWKDRVLGVNRMAEAPLYMTWYATGNNVAVAADTARRICHVRLESPEEHPEERNDFRHPNLLAWVGEKRCRLLGAALTILRAYCVAGRPDLDLPAWGSFEGWSRLVRSAVVWVDLPDPGETRLLLQAQADVGAENMAVLLACWEKLDPQRRGLTASEVIRLLYKDPPAEPPDFHADLKAALEALLGRPDTRGLGNRLRTYRRRIFQGRFIDQTGTKQRAARWAVYPAADFSRSRGEQTHQTHQTHPETASPDESGESGESSLPRPEEWGEV
jgi:hypothetical protein